MSLPKHPKNREEAIALAESGWWRGMDPRKIVAFQLYEDLLCMPFDDFHGAVEAALRRSVYTHEFAFDGIKHEFEGLQEQPDMVEILSLIPPDKRVILMEAS